MGLLVACQPSRGLDVYGRAGRLRARLLRGPRAVIGCGADGDRAAPGAACLTHTPPPVGRSLHVLHMLGSRHSYDLRMHCNLLRFRACPGPAQFRMVVRPLARHREDALSLRVRRLRFARSLLTPSLCRSEPLAQLIFWCPAAGVFALIRRVWAPRQIHGSQASRDGDPASSRSCPYPDFYLGSVTVAGALTGLLFVALSVAQVAEPTRPALAAPAPALWLTINAPRS
jgi:hypothetical protein